LSTVFRQINTDAILQISVHLCVIKQQISKSDKWYKNICDIQDPLRNEIDFILERCDDKSVAS